MVIRSGPPPGPVSRARTGMSFHRRGEPPRAWKSMASPSLGSCGRACVLQAAQGSAVCTSLGPSWPLERPLRVCRAAPGPAGNQYDLWGGRLCSSGQPRRTGAGLSLLGVHLLISREAVRMKCGRTVCVTGLWPTWHERGLQVADSGGPASRAASRDGPRQHGGATGWSQVCLYQACRGALGLPLPQQAVGT